MASSPSPVVTVSSGTPAALARAWLWLGVLALIGSGLLAMLLVLSRTPGIQDIFPLKGFFRAALVVHVDLSVAIWFMAFAAVIWSALGRAGLAWLGHIVVDLGLGDGLRDPDGGRWGSGPLGSLARLIRSTRAHPAA